MVSIVTEPHVRRVIWRSIQPTSSVDQLLYHSHPCPPPTISSADDDRHARPVDVSTFRCAAGLVAAVVFTSAESSLLAIDAHNAHRVVSVSISTAIGCWGHLVHGRAANPGHRPFQRQPQHLSCPLTSLSERNPALCLSFSAPPFALFRAHLAWPAVWLARMQLACRPPPV